MSAEQEDNGAAAVDPGVLRAQHRVGRSLRDKWRLDALLGVGGMAAVYAGTHRNGARGAIKMLHPELSIHDEIRTRFLKEGYVANRVDHPGVVRVLDDDVAEDGALFLVMELLDGESLERRQARLGRLEPDEVLAAADQLLDVLAVAHDKGIVHRDIKPENVFLTRDGTIKVLDFGIARLRELSNASNATKSGTSMGTPAYMPPEQARGRWSEVDGQSDLWAVGATMFTLLTGKVVHEADTTNEQLLAAMTQPAPPISTSAPDLPEPVARVVDKALAYQKADRWATAREMQDAARRAYHRLHGAPISSHPRLTVPPSVADRTLLSAGVSPGTTGRAVVSGRTGLSVRSLQQIPRRKLAIAAGAVAALSIVIGLVLHSAFHHPASAASVAKAPAAQAPAAAEPAKVAAAAQPTAVPSALPSSSASPEPTAISVTALPKEAPTTKPRRPRTVPPTKSAKAVQVKHPRQPAIITTQQNW